MNPFKVALVSIDRVRDDSRLPTWVSDRIAAEGVELVFRQCDDRETLKATAGDADLVWVFGGGRIGSHGVLVVSARVSKYRVHWVRNGSKWVARLEQDI